MHSIQNWIYSITNQSWEWIWNKPEQPPKRWYGRAWLPERKGGVISCTTVVACHRILDIWNRDVPVLHCQFNESYKTFGLPEVMNWENAMKMCSSELLYCKKCRWYLENIATSLPRRNIGAKKLWFDEEWLKFKKKKKKVDGLKCIILTKYYLGSKSFIMVVAEGTKALSPSSPSPLLKAWVYCRSHAISWGLFILTVASQSLHLKVVRYSENVDSNYLGLYTGYIMKFLHKLKVCDHYL